jgi:hypothetical protein
LQTAVGDGAVTLKGSHSMGDGWIFLKVSAPHSLMTTYRKNLISAGFISTDSTFNKKLDVTVMWVRQPYNIFKFGSQSELSASRDPVLLLYMLIG